MEALIGILIVVALTLVVIVQKARMIPKSYQNDYEAPYSDKPLPVEENEENRPYDYERDGE